MRQPELPHRKTQTPIAATQTKIELGYYHNHLVELALLPSSKMIMAKKGYNIPIKTKIPLIQIFSLCSIFIISQFLRFVNIFSGILSNYLPAGRSLPLHKGAFFVHLWLVNFPDKHCICRHKRKIRHTSFEICRISENCPLEWRSK